jgi:glyoxylase-like metal-dependent hydrolase (beta-lactamase superfamily II)
VLSGREGTLVEGDLALTGSGGPRLQIVNTPGHSSDSVGIVFPADQVAATGDLVFDRGSAMIYWPDGSLGAYFTTLDQLSSMVSAFPLAMLLPGHGEPITDPLSQIEAYRLHRLERLDQVREAIAAVGPAPEAVVEHVYGDVGPGLRDAARRTVKAQLQYLRETGELAPEEVTTATEPV